MIRTACVVAICSFALLTGCIDERDQDGTPGPDQAYLPTSFGLVGTFLHVTLHLSDGQHVDTDLRFTREADYGGAPGFSAKTSYLRDPSTGSIYEGPGGDSLILYDEGSQGTVGATIAGQRVYSESPNPAWTYYGSESLSGYSETALEFVVDDPFWALYGAPPMAHGELHFVFAFDVGARAELGFSYTGEPLQGSIRGGQPTPQAYSVRDFDALVAAQGVATAFVGASWSGGDDWARPVLWAAAWPSELNSAQQIEVRTPSGQVVQIGEGRLFEVAVETMDGTWAIDAPAALRESHLDQPIFVAVPLPDPLP